MSFRLWSVVINSDWCSDFRSMTQCCRSKVKGKQWLTMFDTTITIYTLLWSQGQRLRLSQVKGRGQSQGQRLRSNVSCVLVGIAVQQKVIALKFWAKEDHYQPRDFVCVSVIKGLMHIIWRTQSIGFELLRKNCQINSCNFFATWLRLFYKCLAWDWHSSHFWKAIFAVVISIY